jgi:hypothetical protein
MNTQQIILLETLFKGKHNGQMLLESFPMNGHVSRFWQSSQCFWQLVTEVTIFQELSTTLFKTAEIHTMS